MQSNRQRASQNLFFSKSISIVLILFSFTAFSAPEVEVKDGDTIVLGTRKIRFYGIDAPEKKQKCYTINDKPWDCGLEAKTFLEGLVANHEVVVSQIFTVQALCGVTEDFMQQ